MSRAVEGVALLPCPFCGGEASYQWHASPECWIECQKCFAVGPNDENTTTDQHVAAWNTRTTPPARSYADGVEDAAKAVEALRREVPYEYNRHPCSETKRRAVAAIRLLSQGEKA
jgi:hypothetical protein